MSMGPSKGLTVNSGLSTYILFKKSPMLLCLSETLSKNTDYWHKTLGVSLSVTDNVSSWTDSSRGASQPRRWWVLYDCMKSRYAQQNTTCACTFIFNSRVKAHPIFLSGFLQHLSSAYNLTGVSVMCRMLMHQMIDEDQGAHRVAM